MCIRDRGGGSGGRRPGGAAVRRLGREPENQRRPLYRRLGAGQIGFAHGPPRGRAAELASFEHFCVVQPPARCCDFASVNALGASLGRRRARAG
eukprot:6235832-Alexandrium_andersonii.AAC.1